MKSKEAPFHLGAYLFRAQSKKVRGEAQHRIFYFFHKQIIVATNAFLKNTRKVPKGEIDRAKTARTDWLKREEKRK